jgi:signal recognition particle receptor subunit beta
MDFGRVQLEDDLLLYLFGTPGQERFWFMWDNIVRGAIGAVVLVDTRRLAESFTAIDYFDNRQIPYVVAVNTFDGILHHQIESVRKAMALDPSIPMLSCDARAREEVRHGLLRLLEHVISRAEELDPEPSLI